MSKCKSCGEEIEFVMMSNTGRYMPVEKKIWGMIQIDEHGQGHVVKCHKPHWVDCPGSEMHRQKRHNSRRDYEEVGTNIFGINGRRVKANGRRKKGAGSSAR